MQLFDEPMEMGWRTALIYYALRRSCVNQLLLERLPGCFPLSGFLPLCSLPGLPLCFRFFFYCLARARIESHSSGAPRPSQSPPLPRIRDSLVQSNRTGRARTSRNPHTVPSTDETSVPPLFFVCLYWLRRLRILLRSGSGDRLPSPSVV